MVELVAQVGPCASAVFQRSVHDGCVKLLDSGVGADGASKLGAGIGVGSGNGDLEVSTVLSVVYGSLAVKTSTPEGALNVGKRGGVAAAIARLEHRASLEVDIEGD